MMHDSDREIEAGTPAPPPSPESEWVTAWSDSISWRMLQPRDQGKFLTSQNEPKTPETWFLPKSTRILSF